MKIEQYLKIKVRVKVKVNQDPNLKIIKLEILIY